MDFHNLHNEHKNCNNFMSKHKLNAKARQNKKSHLDYDIS